MTTEYVVRNGLNQHDHFSETLSLISNITQWDQTLLCLLVLVSSCCFLNPPHPVSPTRPKDEKAKPFADHWPMTQLWKSPPSNQIVQLEGTEVPEVCPGPLGVTNKLWGVNRHFSQLSRPCDEGKGIQRGTEVTHTHKYQEFSTYLIAL